MFIIARVKDKNVICGYIVEYIDQHNNKIRKFETNLDNYTSVHNAIKLTIGTWKAKSGYTIKTVTIDKIGLEIQNRNTKMVGKPHLLYNYTFAKLSKIQKFLLDKLKEPGIIFLNKKNENIKIRMKDLSALTAYTGVEFSLFERPDSYAVARGTSRGISLNNETFLNLLNKKVL